MTDDPFFEAILASPDDQSLRLVYADWLEERGDSRGQLLRVLHEMSQTPVRSARYHKLCSRRDNLRKRCDGEWLKPMLRMSFPELRKRLAELDGLDPTRAVFASDAHQYRLNPPLPVERVEQIESRIGCRLPEQYRCFVTEFADGAAGPDYGIRPLEALLGGNEDSDLSASLGAPFPVPTNVEEMRQLGYSAPGTLSICEIGCGGYHELILTGPERGNVWVQTDGDWRPALLDDSYLPSGPDVNFDTVLEAAFRSPQGLKLEFLDWYQRWLDEALWKVSCASTDVNELFDLDPETTEVSIAGRTLTTLPDNLRQLTALRSLNLHSTGLTELPDWIGDLTNLEFLGVGANRLSSLPESIGNLRRLRRFVCISTEALEQLPDGIGRLAMLEFLQLSFNRLKAIPDSIGNLSNLRELDLSHNQLTELPATIGGLRQLRKLELTWNKLSQLPATVANLIQLEELDLRANQFHELPDCVSQLPALRTLNLGENPGLAVADACRKLAGVTTLRHLSLSMNKLTELPDEIELLTQLTTLNLGWNQLAGLPASLDRLTNLQELNLDHNPEVINLRNQSQSLLPQLR
jgi:uncharacterized protein (TIGR02996 family)